MYICMRHAWCIIAPTQIYRAFLKEGRQWSITLWEPPECLENTCGAVATENSPRMRRKKGQINFQIYY